MFNLTQNINANIQEVVGYPKQSDFPSMTAHKQQQFFFLSLRRHFFIEKHKIGNILPGTFVCKEFINMSLGYFSCFLFIFIILKVGIFLHLNALT